MSRGKAVLLVCSCVILALGFLVWFLVAQEDARQFDRKLDRINRETEELKRKAEEIRRKAGLKP